ncbi:hypothetical protein [Streptomyces sp. NPDC058644]|uniref:hypothetical protein n=1 Tax=unclassified Streptomyces TaxID=2593676 RepID=UPI0036638C22
MARRKKNKQRSGAAAFAGRTVVIDLLAINSAHGNLTLKGGRANGRPVCIALPAEVLPSFLTQLEHARLDAEEEYWEVVPRVVRTAPDSSPAAASRALEQWLLKQSWSRVLGALPEGAGHALALVSYVGHIGFRLAPPYTPSRVLAIFDPLQLQRLQVALRRQCMLAQQQASTSALHPRDAVDLALRQLIQQPWPPSGAPEPTAEEAVGFMQARHTGFLRRSPYLRASENTLDLPDETG